MLGGVGVGSDEARLSGLVERCGALAAELVLGRVTRSARRTGGGERRGALAAESCSGGILGLAPGTLHARASRQPDRRRSEWWAEIRCPGLTWSRTSSRAGHRCEWRRVRESPP